MNKSLLTKVMAGTVALSTSSCKREPIHRISDASKYPIIERVDSFTKSSLNLSTYIMIPLFICKFIFKYWVSTSFTKEIFITIF